jgi:hypothetical protein
MFVDERWATATFDEAAENPVDVRSGDTAGQFSVTEAAGTAFTEQIIVFCVMSSATVEVADGGNAFFDGLSAFDDQWSVALEGEEVPGEQSGGT